MPNATAVSLVVIAAAAVLAPLLSELLRRWRIPSVLFELLLGILIGPAVLGWVEIDEPVRVLSILGLATLLFLAGLEIDYDRLRGRVARLAGGGFVVSFLIAIAVGLALAIAIALTVSPSPSM